jgi:hypothetical protein
MNIRLILFIPTLLISFLVFAQNKNTLLSTDKYFEIGEKLEFSINYGWFQLGKAEAIHGERKNFINGIDHYSVDLQAKTVGFLSFIKNVEAHFLSFLQTATYKPTYSEKQMLEGKEEWDQTNLFNYDSMTVDVSVTTSKKWKYRNWIVDMEDNTFDILGTYMYLRNVDWSQLQIGDSLMLSTLYEKKIYDFGIENGGFEKITWQDSEYKAYKLYILFPISKAFPEEKAVIFWVIEKDGVRLPVLVEANMRFGKVTCKLERYSLLGEYN